MKFIGQAFLLVVCAFSFNACSVNKAKIDNNLKKYFDTRNVTGCFSMLNNATGGVTVYNMELDTMRYLPASTFKIVNALIGLETGAITDDSMVVRWDGVRRSVKEWNRNLDLPTAFKVSSVPYFQEIARRIGKDSMQQWINHLGYGNMVVGEPVDSFWLNNQLKISPDEQLGLMKKLYFDQLPFRKSTHQTVRNMMLQEDNTLYRLSYKTGSGFNENNESIGWVVGWIEENTHVYFFVTLVKSDDPEIDMPNVHMNITRDILKELGFFEGKK